MSIVINSGYVKSINCYAGQNEPKYIVIHETDNYGKKAHALAHAKAHYNGNLTTSVHYYVDDGKQGHEPIYKTLDHKDGAYAVGKVYGVADVPDANNKNTINIEICVNPETDYNKAWLNCIELVKDLMTITGIPADRVIRHYDAKKKYCPRKMMDNPALWSDFKQRLNNVVESIVSVYDIENGKWLFRRTIKNGNVIVSDDKITESWVKYKNKWFYVDKDGWMLTGLQKIGGVAYYLNESKEDVSIYGALMVTKDPVSGGLSVCYIEQ